MSEAVQINDAHDEPDTGKPPCDFCRRVVPCECMDGPCMCTCGRCCAPFPWGLPDRPLPPAA
jgi:hypothetical protein